MVNQSQFIEMFGDPITNSQERKQKAFVDVVTLHRGYDLPEGKRVSVGSIPIYGANGFLGYHDCAMAKDGIVTGRSGAIGEVYAVQGPYWPLNTALFSIDTHGNNLTYLSYLIRFFDIKRFGTGTGVPTLNRNDVHKEKIYDVDLKEQEAFEKIAKQADKSKFAGFKSQFIEMFGDYTINPKGWPVESFDGFARIDATMTTDYDKYADYPHIGVDSIEKKTGILSGYRTVKEDNVISGKYLFSPKHIIYSKIRPNLNKVALPDFYGVCSADAYPILPTEGKCDRIYLAYLMRSDFFLSYILKFSARSNMPKVNREQIRGFRAPLPPFESQKKFSDIVKRADKSKYLN